MAVVLEDAILVLLGDRSRSAYELAGDHARFFAGVWPVDLRRVTVAIGRLERAGLVHLGSMPAIRSTSGTRRACEVTPAGRRRQTEWMRTVPADTGIEDLRIRGMLAVASTDRRLLDAFLASGSAHVERRVRDLGPAAAEAAGPVEHAALAFDREVMAAIARWLRVLAGDP